MVKHYIRKMQPASSAPAPLQDLHESPDPISAPTPGAAVSASRFMLRLFALFPSDALPGTALDIARQRPSIDRDTIEALGAAIAHPDPLAGAGRVLAHLDAGLHLDAMDQLLLNNLAEAWGQPSEAPLCDPRGAALMLLALGVPERDAADAGLPEPLTLLKGNRSGAALTPAIAEQLEALPASMPPVVRPGSICVCPPQPAKWLNSRVRHAGTPHEERY